MAIHPELKISVPGNSKATDIPPEKNYNIDTKIVFQEEENIKPRQYEIVWPNVLLMSAIHLSALYGLYLTIFYANWATVVYLVPALILSAFGITAGAHRLWSHRAYKAKLPLKLILLWLQTSMHQNSVIEWCRDHRLHHKFQDTDADPHNAKRGFFFSHMGWLMVRKHEDVKIKGKTIDLSDLYADPLLKFQHDHFYYLMILCSFILPTVGPVYLWDETWRNSFYINHFRYVSILHSTWCVNSIAHLWGNRPYDKFQQTFENLFVSIVAVGEGWHNYHHVFPWDYKASEISRLNISTFLINMFAKIGWAYDLKTVSDDMIQKRVLRTGDGSHGIWGWGDKDQTVENYKSAIILN